MRRLCAFIAVPSLALPSLALPSLAALCAASPAFAEDAEDAPPVSFSASVALATDYRFRGISQTENDLALQGGFKASHESGFYVGTWASNLSGWGTFGGANLELDLYGGYTTELGSVTVDGGVIWYVFPQGSDNTSYGEFYGSLARGFGPATVTVGANYAFKQSALSLAGEKEDNIYVYSKASAAIENTPVTLNASIGYSDGNAGAGPNGWVASPTGAYLDWSAGVSVALPWGPISLSATYVDTDISRAEATAFQLINPGYRYGIGAATGVFAITASF
jgi:uncharacterized protein (TIGR02001 family)